MSNRNRIFPWSNRRLTEFWLTGLILIGLTGCTGSLLTDVTPLPDYEPAHQVLSSNPSDVDISPLLPPDPAAGQIVYAENCAACHGKTGMGDGERASSLPVLPPPVGSITYNRESSPVIWFQTITQGKIDRLMPGFNNSLSDRQRWDVVAYLLSVGVTRDQLDAGKQTFTQYCRYCHGDTAAGGVRQAPALTNADLLRLSLDDITQIIAEGKGAMPALNAALTEDQQLNIALYLRSRDFAAPTTKNAGTDRQTTPIPTPLPEPTGQSDQTQNIRGRVINGSGGSIPANLEVELTGFDAMQPVYSEKQPLQTGGRFSFEHLPHQAGRIYILTTIYKGIQFSSGNIHSEQPEEMQNQQFSIFESTTDASQLKAERLHIFFEFPGSDIIRVSQLYVLSNPTKSLVISPDAKHPVLDFFLPAGASNLQFENGTLGQRFVLTQDGVGDTQEIPPGSGAQVLFSFDLPYKTEAFIPIKVGLPVDTANIMLPSTGVSVKSSQLQDLGEKTIQNTTWHIYTSSNLASGSNLDLLVSGKPKVADPQEEELNTNLAVGLFSLGIALLIVSSVIFQRVSSRKSLTPAGTTPALEQTAQDAILDAIIALDDQYHAGQIPLAAYRERRAELKERLRGGRS